MGALMRRMPTLPPTLPVHTDGSFRRSIVAASLGAAILIGVGIAIAVSVIDTESAERRRDAIDPLVALAARMNAPNEVPDAVLLVGDRRMALPLLWSWWRRRGQPPARLEPQPPRWVEAQKAPRTGPEPRLVIRTNRIPARIFITTSEFPNFGTAARTRTLIAAPSAKALAIARTSYHGRSKPLIIERCLFRGRASICLRLPLSRLARYAVISAQWRTVFRDGAEGLLSSTEWAIEVVPAKRAAGG
jgi:hypothetical protein